MFRAHFPMPTLAARSIGMVLAALIFPLLAPLASAADPLGLLSGVAPVDSFAASACSDAAKPAPEVCTLTVCNTTDRQWEQIPKNAGAGCGTGKECDGHGNCVAALPPPREPQYCGGTPKPAEQVCHIVACTAEGNWEFLPRASGSRCGRTGQCDGHGECVQPPQMSEATGLIGADALGTLKLFPFGERLGRLGTGRDLGQIVDATHLLAGNWDGGAFDSLLVRTASGEARIVEPNAADIRRVSPPVAADWHYTDYFPGHWGGADRSSLMVRSADGEVRHLRLVDGRFRDDGSVPARGWHFAQYFPADWNGDGGDDMLARDAAGDVFLFPFFDGQFQGGAGIKVASGWHASDYFVGHWAGDGSADMLLRQPNGEIYFYPFRTGGTFGNPVKVAEGWHYTDYRVADWDGDAIDDILARAADGGVYLLEFVHGSFAAPRKVAESWDFTQFIAGKWSPRSPPAREMTGGRMAKLPVTQYFASAVTITGQHRLSFRSVCRPEDSATNRCDTGMIVHWGNRTLYNNDDPAAEIHGTGSGKGSFVETPQQNGNITYSLSVFSQSRASSRTNVEYSFDGGRNWSSLTRGFREVGGTVVRVGALHRGDFLEVQTRGDGRGNADTRMLLFSPDDAPDKPVLMNEDRSATDRDPRLAIDGDAWTRDDRNYVLVGKSQVTPATNDGIETHVDLIHGPLSKGGSVSRTACGGSCGATLPPGHYLLSLTAATAHPVGSTRTARFLSGNMPVLQNDGCPTAARDGTFPGTPAPGGLPDAVWYRGQANDRAFTLAIQQLTPRGWMTIRQRIVPRGAIGSDRNIDAGRFSLPLEVAQTGTFRLVAIEPAANVTLRDTWNWERNPEATELSVVTYNSLFVSEAWDANKIRNAADLLGTRGSVIAAEGRVEERLDQVPFQWEADIIGVQEMKKERSDNFPGNRYTQIMFDELRLRSALDWSYAQGRGETWPTALTAGPGMNPIFISQNAYPGSAGSSVFFSAGAKRHADCWDGMGLATPEFIGGAYYNECHLSQRWLGSSPTQNYATAAKASVWRGGTRADRPISVFNVHMQASEGPDHFGPRIGELRSLMEKMDRFLEADHLAFNRAVESDPNKSSPLHGQNRAIIVGDWNIRAHECGEHYWMLRMLREHFGYAVDVSMALADRMGSLRQSMHTGDGGYGPDEVPVGYQHMTVDDPRSPSQWREWQKSRDHSIDSAFPWWATDWRDKSTFPDHAGERLSMIVLVGRGWADDDPVLDYEIMSDSNFLSPMNPAGRGVEMWFATCSSDGAVAADRRGYAPNYPLGCGSTEPGAPALQSDHKPMRARLRVWGR